MSSRRTLVVRKQASDDDTTDTVTASTMTHSDEYSSDVQQEAGAGDGCKNKFKSISNSDYRRPRKGTRQENMSAAEIRDKLKGYIKVRDKSILSRLPPFKTWIKYINKETGQFRTGGLLMKAAYPKYITLVNTQSNISWSVQLADNDIYIRDPDVVRQQNAAQQKKTAIKDKLFELYQRGNLAVVKDERERDRRKR